MGTTVYTKPLSTADLSSGLTKFQKVIFNENVILTGFQTWFVVFNNPTFTNLYFELYSVQSNVPKKLIATSTNVVTKAEMFTLPYAYKGIPMLWDNVTLKGTDSYALVPRATGYTYSSGSWLGWMLGFPDPGYRLNLPLTSKANLGRSPFSIPGFIGSEL